ncbi:hypothetical protein [Paenibacillus massiliensis]|uniref:hypothetical protein n=1 Tax=Paenibacillus massiliensis TaxID=225917 RepID=UPI000472EE6C|nr:hypothetical protein [Paenibacillus massiliensis]
MMARRWELGIGWFGAIVALVFMGGFSVVIGQMSLETFETSLYPMLRENNTAVTLEDSYEALRTLGAWFGTTVTFVLILVVFASYSLGRKGRYVIAAVLYGLAGLLILLGTQMLGFPVAFLFFVSTILCIWRGRQQAQNL